MEAKEKIKLTKLNATRRMPLLAPLIAELKEIEAPVETLALSYKDKTVYYNEQFVENLENVDALLVYIHEVMHYLFIHDASEIKDRALQLAHNITSDAIINELISRRFKDEYDRSKLFKEASVKIEHLKELIDEIRDKDIDEILKEYDSYYLARLLYKKYQQMFGDLMQRIQDDLQTLENSLNQQSSSSQENNNSSNANNNNSNSKDDIEKALENIAKAINDVVEKHMKDNSDEAKNIMKRALSEAIKDMISKSLEKMSKEAREKLKEEVRRAIEKGKMLAKQLEEKQRGEETLSIEEIIDIILKRKRRNWRKVLRETASEIRVIMRDYDWTRKSRKAEILERQLNRKVFIPSIKKEDYRINVVIGIDTSGSISDDEYREFVNEVYNLMKDINVKGYVVMWEAEVTKVIEIKNGWNKEVLEELAKRKGYGGTVIASFFKKAEELAKNRKRQTYIIVFTDGETETVKQEWVKGWKKVIFVISKYGIIENLRDVKKLRNVVITQMD